MQARAGTRARIGIGCLVASLATGATGAYAQEGVLRGVVIDKGGAPITDAAVSILALHYATRTDQQGRFIFSNLSRGEAEVSVRRLGYEPVSIQLRLSGGGPESLSVTLAGLPELLSPVGISASERRHRQGVEDFYWRRARGVGTFFTRDEMLSRQASVPSDVLRSTPGIKFVRSAGGHGIRFMSSTGRRDCIPPMWIDGQRAPGVELDDVPVNDIEGIELYQGLSTTPAPFYQGSGATPCGAIVVWIRVPGA